MTATASLPVARSWVAPISIAAAAVWAVLRSGAGALPPSDLATLATVAQSWPRSSSGPLPDNYVNNPLAQLLAQLVNATTPSQFLLMHTVVVVIAISGLGLWAFSSARGPARAQATRLVLLAPIVAVLLTWMGFYDPFTVVCWLVALFAWRSGWRWAMVLGGVLLGFQHFEQAAAGAAAWILLWLALRSDESFARHRNPTWVLLGVPLGKLLLVVVLSSADVGGSGSRIEWLVNPTLLRQAVASALNTGPLLLWSLFAGFWVVVAYVWLVMADRRQQVLMAAAVAIPLLLTVVTLDRPRVFAMTSIPVVLMLAVLFANRMSTLADRRLKLALESVLWLATPLIFWGDELFNLGAVDRLIVYVGQVTG